MGNGQQWGSAIGTIAGLWLPGGPSVWGTIGGIAGSYISPTVLHGPSIGDAQAQTSMAGMPIPKFFGHCPPVAPTLIDGDKIARKVTRENGGKGSTTVQETEGFIATRFFLVGESDGNAQIARIYRNGKLVYSTIAADELDADSSVFAGQMTIWNGGPTQGPSPALEAIHGVGNVNYYRKRLCFEVRDDDETQTGGMANQYRVEVIGAGTATTECAPVPWVHGNTGSIQTIFDADIYRKTAITAGWNNNLRRTTDGGRVWREVDYTTTTGWDPTEAIVAVWHEPNPLDEKTWYIALYNEIAISYTDGGLFTEYMTPVHEIVGGTGTEGGVTIVNGLAYAGAAETANTVIFQPLSVGDTDVDFGADHGRATAIAAPGGGEFIVGTSKGKIVREDGTVLYSDPFLRPISSFAFGNGKGIATLSSGGYLRTDDNFTTYVIDGGLGTAPAAGFARGAFYIVTRQKIYSSVDAENWDEVDDYFFEDSSGQFLLTDGTSVLATTLNGLTSALPTFSGVPDGTGLYLDEIGHVVGGCNTRIAGDAVMWKDIAIEIAARSHPLLPDQMVVDHMTDLVPGFMLGNLSLTGADYLRTLCMFGAEKVTDLVERDDEVYANRRGGAVVGTFDPEDLLFIEQEDDDTRDQAVKGYKRLTLMYPDPANNYVPTPQTAPRTSPDVTASNNVTMECPIPFDADTMAQKADIMQKIAFMELEGSFKRNFRAQYSRYVPSDPIEFNDRRWLITKAGNDDSMVRFEGRYDRPSAYTSAAVGTVAPPPEPQTSNIKGPTIGLAMNLPALQSSDNTPGMRIAAARVLPGWAGTDVYLSTDQGASERLVASIMNSARMGELTDDVDVDGNDSNGLISVLMYGGAELESVTAAQIDAGANAFAITTSGISEVGQDQTATETAPSEYDLSDVVRGGLGTTAAQHYSGDPFVMLDDTILIPIDIRFAGQMVRFRFVSRGTAVANNEPFWVLYDPQFTGPQTVEYRITQTGDQRVTQSNEPRLVV